MSFFPFLEAVILELNIPGRWKAYINHIHVDWQRYRQNPVFLVSSLLDLIPACPFILIWHVKSTLLTLCWKLRPCCVFGLYVKVGDYFAYFWIFWVQSVKQRYAEHKSSQMCMLDRQPSSFPAPAFVHTYILDLCLWWCCDVIWKINIYFWRKKYWQRPVRFKIFGFKQLLKNLTPLYAYVNARSDG